MAATAGATASREEHLSTGETADARLPESSTGRNSVQIFPHVIVRFVPRRITDLERVRSRHLASAIAALEAAHRRAEKAKDDLSNAIYVEVGPILGTRQANRLLEARRRLYNGRGLREKDCASLRASNGLASCLTTWEIAVRDYQASWLRFRRTHQEALHSALITIAELCRQSEIPRALAMASPDLWEAFAGLQNGELLRERKLCFALARYVYRAYTKTSPFSWFTVVGHVRLFSTRPPGQIPSGSEQSTISIQPSGFILGDIWEHARDCEGIRVQMPTVVNPTLRGTDSVFCWYTNTGNCETLREVLASPEMARFVSLLADRQPLSLTEAICQAERLEWVKAYGPSRLFQTLLHRGFLVQPCQVSVTGTNWIQDLLTWFERAGQGDHTTPFTAALRCLSSFAKALGDADADARVVLLSEAQRHLHSLLGAPEDPKHVERTPRVPQLCLPAARREPRRAYARGELFYENVGMDVMLDLAAESVYEVCTNLELLAQEAGFLDPNRITRRRLAEFMRKRYGSPGDVEFLRVFEDLQNDRRRRLQEDPSASSWVLFGDSEELNDQRLRVSTWCQRIADSVLNGPSARSQGIVELRGAVLDECRLPEDLWRAPDAPRSRACTLQIGRVREGTVWVLHHPEIDGGYGRTISRFLHVLPSEVTDELRQWNARMPLWARTAENVDGSLFNANVHPPLTTWETAIPGGVRGSATAGQIPLSALFVRLTDGDEGDVQLVHRDGAPVYICDLGFQTRGRSAVFELLNAFSINSDVMLHALLESI